MMKMNNQSMFSSKLTNRLSLKIKKIDIHRYFIATKFS